MSAFHNSADGERHAMAAHRAMKWLSGGIAVLSLISAGLHIGGFLWHAQGEHDHRSNLKSLGTR